jgi:hypothetical protein
VAPRLVEALDLDPHLRAQRGVEVAQGLVEEEQLRARAMARPMATRCRWPPDISLGKRSSRFDGEHAATSSTRAAISSGTRRSAGRRRGCRAP